MKKLLLAVLLCGLLTPFASAETGELAHSAESSLAGAVPGGAQEYLDGVTLDGADDVLSSFASLLQNAQVDGRHAVQSALGGLLRAAFIIVLAAVARGLSSAAGGAADGLIDMAASLGCAAVLLGDFAGVLALCRETLEQISVFSGALQPVLATVLAAGGSAATATVVQTASMLVSDLTIRLVSTLLVPAACAYLAIAAVDAAMGNGMLHGAAEGAKSLTAGALKLILTLFTAYLAIAGGVSGSVDRMALKTAKFAVSGAVPVVGGVISDAAETVLSGASLLRGSVGVFGMLCVTAICLAPFLRAGASYLLYKAGAALLSPLCSGSLRALLESIGTGYGLLLGMLSACCMIFYLELVYVIAMVKPI